MKKAAALLAGAVVAAAAPLGAQMSPGARSVAMGGGGMVFATGVDAVEWNPANLGWAQGWNVSVFELGGVALGDGATIDEIRTILGDDGPGLNVTSVVSGLPASGIHVIGVTEGYATAFGARKANIPEPGSPLPTMGVAMGPVAVRVRSRVFSDLVLSKPVADLIGNGFQEENIRNYSVGNTGWRTASLTEFTVSYGTQLAGLLSIGVGGRYVKGNGLVDGRFFEPTIDLTNTTLSMQTVAVEAKSGTGYGLDVGVSLELPAGWRASASGTNVFQKMNWDETLVAHTATFTDADFTEGDVAFEDLINRFDDEPVDPSSVSLEVFQAGGQLFEQSYFPEVYRVGVGWQSGGTSLEAVGVKISPRGRFSSAWDQRISLGVEQVLPIITLRGGYAMADEGLKSISAGLGLHVGPIHLDASGGKFSGERALGPWEGYYVTAALQVKGGGL